MAQYLKPDSALGYIEDTAEIECLKFNNLRHIILGCMLGDFNEVGTYVVSPQIVRELIAMEKYVVQTYDNIEICKSAIKLDKQISFMVTFEGNRATLSLIEKLNYEANFALNSGTYSNINEFVLDSVETSGEINRNVIYDRWNIKLSPSNVIDIFNCDEEVLAKYFGIVARFKYLLKANTVLLEKESKLEESEAKYTNAIFTILDRYPDLKKAVEKTIQETLNEKKEALMVGQPFFVKTFNEVLENAIQQNLGVITENEKLEFIEEKRQAVVDLNVSRSDTLNVEHVNVEKSQHLENAPKVIKVSETFEETKKSLLDTAQEFVKIHKSVSNNLNQEYAEQDVKEKSALNSSNNSALLRRVITAVMEKKGEEVDLSQIEELKNLEGKTEKSKLIIILNRMGYSDLIGTKKQNNNEKVAEEKPKEETKAPAKTPSPKKKEEAAKVGTIKFKDVNYNVKPSKAPPKKKEEEKKAETKETDDYVFNYKKNNAGENQTDKNLTETPENKEDYKKLMAEVNAAVKKTYDTMGQVSALAKEGEQATKTATQTVKQTTVNKSAVAAVQEILKATDNADIGEHDLGL